MHLHSRAACRTRVCIGVCGRVMNGSGCVCGCVVCRGGARRVGCTAWRRLSRCTGITLTLGEASALISLQCWRSEMTTFHSSAHWAKYTALEPSPHSHTTEFPSMDCRIASTASPLRCGHTELSILLPLSHADGHAALSRPRGPLACGAVATPLPPPAHSRSRAITTTAMRPRTTSSRRLYGCCWDGSRRRQASMRGRRQHDAAPARSPAHAAGGSPHTRRGAACVCAQLARRRMQARPTWRLARRPLSERMAAPPSISSSSGGNRPPRRDPLMALLAGRRSRHPDLQLSESPLTGHGPAPMWKWFVE